VLLPTSYEVGSLAVVHNRRHSPSLSPTTAALLMRETLRRPSRSPRRSSGSTRPRTMSDSRARQRRCLGSGVGPRPRTSTCKIRHQGHVVGESTDPGSFQRRYRCVPLCLRWEAGRPTGRARGGQECVSAATPSTDHGVEWSGEEYGRVGSNNGAKGGGEGRSHWVGS
jgi:hypothetical protein